MGRFAVVDEVRSGEDCADGRPVIVASDEPGCGDEGTASSIGVLCVGSDPGCGEMVVIWLESWVDELVPGLGDICAAPRSLTSSTRSGMTCLK